MKTLQLFKDGKEIIASDGIMYVDGRLNPSNVKREVIERNKRFAKNFPHKIADAFAIYRGRIGGSLGPVINLNLVMLVLLIVGLTSCSKEHNNPEPVKPQTVTYAVTCKSCLVYFEDNQWNRSNHIEDRPDAVSQHINVYGSWTTDFVVSTLDTASLRIYTGSFAPDQSVRLYITDSKGKSIDQTINMGVDNQDVYAQLPLSK